MQYTTITKGSQYEYWSGRCRPDFVPNERQKMLMDAYREARADGKYYTKDVLAFALKRLEVTPEVAAIGADRVEGGDVGMDMYYARDAVNNMERLAQMRIDSHNLNPVVGMKLGSLLLNGKRTQACTITQMDDMDIEFSGVRGGKTYLFYSDPSRIVEKMKEAETHGWRKSSSI